MNFGDACVGHRAPCEAAERYARGGGEGGDIRLVSSWHCRRMAGRWAGRGAGSRCLVAMSSRGPAAVSGGGQVPPLLVCLHRHAAAGGLGLQQFAIVAIVGAAGLP
jgi:hypothetical protein